VNLCALDIIMDEDGEKHLYISLYTYFGII
jgi:hypothetical protein